MTADTGISGLRPAVHLKCSMRPPQSDGAETTRNPGLYPGCYESAISLREFTRI